MSFTETFISTHDIDWFVIINDRLVHVASAGGAIPKSVTNNLKQAAIFVARLETTLTSDQICTISPSTMKKKLGISSKEQRTRYLETFEVIAKKGIFSFDRTVVSDIEDKHYHIVAWPKDTTMCFKSEFGKRSPFLSIKSDKINFDAPEELQDVRLYEIVLDSLQNHPQ